MPTDTYSIVDLARLTGVNVRTIRYYLAQGLLPASGESGPGAHYSEGHLDRLRLTRRLQKQHLPLAEIRRRLAELSDEEVASVTATTEEPEQRPTTTALDYVRSVLAGPLVSLSTAALPAASIPAASIPAASIPAVPGAAPLAARLRIDAANFITAGPRANTTAPMAVVAESGPAPSEPPTHERSQWERLSLSPNIELHIRRPLGRLEQRRVERLISIARQVLKEEKP